jgi:hypothetical protein
LFGFHWRLKHGGLRLVKLSLLVQRRRILVGLIFWRKDEAVGLRENPVLYGLHVRLVFEVADEGPWKSKLIMFC